MLTNVSFNPVNKDAIYHNIFKDALKLRFHRERHVCIKKNASISSEPSHKSQIVLSMGADNAINKLHANRC